MLKVGSAIARGVYVQLLLRHPQTPHSHSTTPMPAFLKNCNSHLLIAAPPTAPPTAAAFVPSLRTSTFARSLPRVRSVQVCNGDSGLDHRPLLVSLTSSLLLSRLPLITLLSRLPLFFFLGFLLVLIAFLSRLPHRINSEDC